MPLNAASARSTPQWPSAASMISVSDRPRQPPTPSCSSALPDLAIIVELAVEDDDMAAVGRSHGLMAGRRQVEDREAPEAERDAGLGVDELSRVVGPAMGERRGHGLGRPRQASAGAASPAARMPARPHIGRPPGTHDPGAGPSDPCATPFIFPRARRSSPAAIPWAFLERRGAALDEGDRSPARPSRQARSRRNQRERWPAPRLRRANFQARPAARRQAKRWSSAGVSGWSARKLAQARVTRWS